MESLVTTQGLLLPELPHYINQLCVFHLKEGFLLFQAGSVVQLVVHLTQEPKVPGLILSLSTYFHFPFC